MPRRALLTFHLMTPPTSALRYDRGTLLLDSPQRPADDFAPGCWTYDPRVHAWRTHAIHYAAARRLCDIADELPPPPRVAFPAADLPSLRKEQADAVEAWRRAGGRGLIVMPTGTGKTEVALSIIARARVSTLIVAPVRDLMYQWHTRLFRRLGYDAGILGDAKRLIKPITVTTYDSAYLHMSEFGDRFGLIIFDEAHHLPGDSFREAALLSAAPLRLGLTATPYRSDGRHADLQQLIGPLVYEQHIADAKGKSVADYSVVRIPVRLEEGERRRYDAAGDTIRSYLIAQREADPKYAWENVCKDAARDPAARRTMQAYFLRKSIEDRAEEKLRILEDIFRLHAGQRCLVFAGTNAMARDVSRRFLAPTLLNHSRKDERRIVLEGFASGAFPILIANRVLDEGVDVPEAKVAVVIGGQSSPRQAKQRLGRILRRTGDVAATLYEVVVEDTKDVQRSRARRRSDAFGATRRWSSDALQ